MFQIRIYVFVIFLSSETLVIQITCWLKFLIEKAWFNIDFYKESSS
jgi:hypothetical protein